MVESVLIISDQSPVGKNFAAETIRIGSGFVALGEFIDCKIVFFEMQFTYSTKMILLKLLEWIQWMKYLKWQIYQI